MAELAIDNLGPWHMRRCAERIDWDKMPTSPLLDERIGAERRHVVAAVLIKLLDLCSKEDWTFRGTVTELAAKMSLSARTVGHKLLGLEALGLLRRKNNGPAPWTTFIDVQAIARIARERSIYLERPEREEPANPRWRRRVAAIEEDLKGAPPLEDAGDAGDAPSSQDDGAPPRRRKKRRPKAPPALPRTTSQLASLLWNVSPWRPRGSEPLQADTRWPENVLDLPADQLWDALTAYHVLCVRGGKGHRPAAVDWGAFCRWRVWDVLQLLDGPENMTEPDLGRDRRPKAEVEAIRTGRQLYYLADPPALDRRRADLLAPWLAQLYDYERFPGRLAEVLRQTGPPPDWLPAELAPRWGALNPFILPI